MVFRFGVISEDFEYDEVLEEDSESDIDDSDDNKLEQEMVKLLMLDKKFEVFSMKESDYDGIEMLVFCVIDLEIGNDLNELKNDNDVQYCLINGDLDDESLEFGFYEQDQDFKYGFNGYDDISFGEDEVCDFFFGIV